jgi:hypothetical protein
MNFKDFCDKAETINKQIVSTGNSFVINFTKQSGTAFSIDPAVIVNFLKYVSSNHPACVGVIEAHELFSKDSYLNYQEKPYRALYELVSDELELKPISSLGGSQTKGLTQVISKFICYVAKIPYEKIEDNTHFDKEYIDSALEKMPDDLTTLSQSSSDYMPLVNTKKAFERWLSKKISPKTGNLYTEKSIKSYSGTSINLANKLLRDADSKISPIFSITSAELIESANAVLKNIGEWNEKNKNGNNMFQAGLNHYLGFLSEYSPSHITCLPKPFILLAGLSGTGKTRFVKEQALATKVTENNHCLVSVRPDWHEPSDLLGYVSRMNGSPEYVCTKVLDFIIKAWQVVAPEAEESGYGELNYSAEPFWLCLDEMNLAPVEQYFADYLSVLESRKFDREGYFCEALLDSNLLRDLTTGGGNVQSELGLKNNNGLWQCFLNHGIAIPPNLIVAGTVNMDETTHGFSRKVIDRAFTFDFGEFFPNDFDSFFEPVSQPKTFSYSLNIQATKEDLSATSDADGEKSIAFLKAANGILNQTPFELAYRALNELLLQVACFNPSSDAQLQAVWDDFLMAKVLPRIDGDEDKLRYINGVDSDNLLLALSKLLEVQLNEIWDSNRHDFYRENIDGSAIDDIPCRSKAKLQWMQNRLEVNTFTSFWP